MDKKIKEKHGKNIFAIVGLGNPGPQYSKTRHNIGFRVLDEVADRYNLSWHTAKDMEYAELERDGDTILLIKPQTYMNSSGKIIPALQKKGIKVHNILVVHDELEKPFGKIAFKEGGSARGHNGLKSIISFVGAEFLRLRCGIGRPDDKSQVHNYVLQTFAEHVDEVAEFIGQAADALEDLIFV